LGEALFQGERPERSNHCGSVGLEAMRPACVGYSQKWRTIGTLIDHRNGGTKGSGSRLKPKLLRTLSPQKL